MRTSINSVITLPFMKQNTIIISKINAAAITNALLNLELNLLNKFHATVEYVLNFPQRFNLFCQNNV